MELAADGAGELRQPPLDRHVDVLVPVGERELPALQLARDQLEPGDEGIELAIVEDAGAVERPSVGDRPADVLRPKPPVEADRGVDAPEQRILGCIEAAHGHQGLKMRGSVSGRERSTGQTTCTSPE